MPRETGDKRNTATKASENVDKAFQAVAKTKEGQAVFRYLMVHLGFKSPSLAADATGKILIDNVINNEARRNVWLHIRSKIPNEFTNIIEREEEPDHE